jgi:hypothetical protein
MQQSKFSSNTSVLNRTNKIRKAFHNATPELQTKIYELIPFTRKSGDGSNIIDFCDWQQWSQWSQTQ